jgi:hypothetical protein
MQYLKVFGLAALLGAAACSNSTPQVTAPAPSSPSTAAGTLKVTAPSPTSPANGVEFPRGQRSTTLEAQAARGEFVDVAPASHRVELYQGDSLANSQMVNASGGRVTMGTGDLLYRTAYRWRMRAESSQGAGPWSSFNTFMTGASVQARTPDGATNHGAAQAQLAAVGGALAGSSPDLVHHSCQEHDPAGWAFLDGLVDRLRESDNRWGYNGKRGNPGDPSFDVVAYHYGNGPSEGSRDVWIWDVLIGHCGPSPSFSVSEINSRTPPGAAIWITRGRFQNEY